MISKLLIPVVAAGLLAGCVTDYTYRRDGGDYYYGRPSVEYRYHYPYGYYPYGGYGGYHYPYNYSRYGYYPYPVYPYGYYPYHRYPRNYYPYYRPPVQPQPGTTPLPNTRHRDGAPWRNLDDVVRRRRESGVTPGVQPQTVQVPQPISQPRPTTEARREGSPLGQMMRRAQDERRKRDSNPEP